MFDDNQFETNDDTGPGQREIRTLLARPTELVVELLRRRHIVKLPKSITKDNLRSKLNTFIRGHVLEPADLANILEELQGWGHQQVYLLRFRGNESERRNWSRDWSDEESVRSRFGNAKLSDIFNNARQVDPKDSPTLTKAEYCPDSGTVRLLWAERILTRVREDAEDEAPPPFELSTDGTSVERIVYLAFRETEERDVSSVELDFDNGIATILIRKVSDRNYREIRNQMIEDIEDLLAIDEFFEPVLLRKLMENLFLVQKLNTRRIRFQSPHNRGTAELASGTQEDLYEDQKLQEVASSLAEDSDATSVSLRWPLSRQRHLGIFVFARYGNDQRIGIDSQALEADVRHVLQEIRRYST